MTLAVGILMTPGAGTTKLVVDAERAGFDSAWFVDSPILFGDAFVAMAAAAAATSTIKVASGVTNPVLRSAPILASSFATLEVNSPGRVIMGIGTGFTSTGAMGLPAAKLSDAAAFIDTVRALLRGEVREITFDDHTHRSIGFLNTTLPWLDPEARIPVYFAASGPKAIELAARVGDGILLGGITQPEVIADCIDVIRATRLEQGQDPDGAEIAITPSVYITDRDVDLDDPDDFEHLREELGPKSLAPAQNFSTIASTSKRVPPALVEQLLAVKAAYRPPTDDDGDPRTSHMRAYRGYMTQLREDQRPLVTPSVLRATTIVGSPEQCASQLRVLEQSGITHVVLSPLPHHRASTIETFGRDVLPAI